MKKIFVSAFVVVAGTSQAFVPTKLMEADNFGRRVALKAAIQQLQLEAEPQVTYHQFQSEAGKFDDDFMDLGLRFQVWVSNQRAYQCESRLTVALVDGTSAQWRVSHGGGVDCKQIPATR